jgi:hypothetical protein
MAREPKRAVQQSRSAEVQATTALPEVPDRPLAIKLTLGELQRHLALALTNDRDAERTLITYFCNAWDIGIEPNQAVLRDYCHTLFAQALSRRSKLLRASKGRPPRQLLARDIHVAATVQALVNAGIRAGDAIARTASALHISAKLVEKISREQRRSHPAQVQEIAESERDVLLANVLNKPST